MKVKVDRNGSQVAIEIDHSIGSTRLISNFLVTPNQPVRGSYSLITSNSSELEIKFRSWKDGAIFELKNTGLFQEFKKITSVVIPHPRKEASTVKLNIDNVAYKPIAVLGNPSEVKLDDLQISPLENFNGERLRSLSVDKNLLSEFELLRDNLNSHLNELRIDPNIWDSFDGPLSDLSDLPELEDLFVCETICIVILIVAIIGAIVTLQGEVALLGIIAALICLVFCYYVDSDSPSSPSSVVPTI